MSSALSPSSIRYGAAALAATAALVAAGCGSSRPQHQRSPRQPTFVSTHTVQQVQQHFQAVTGQALSDSPSAVWDTLSLPSDNTQDYNRFGTFSIDILHRADDLGVFTTQNGRRLIPDAHGVYWPLTADTSGYWNPAKVYGNVVLTWTTPTHATNGQFTLLNAILSTLGQSPSAVTAKLPASELSCQAQGITPVGRREGTCQENGVTRTVVNREHTLQAPDMDVQVTQTKLGRIITPLDSFQSPVSAQGEFVAVRVKLTNTGSSPIEDFSAAELEIGGKFYSQNFDATFDLSSLNTFPLQPGESGTTVVAFDVPRNAAVNAIDDGELVVPEDPNSTVEFSSKLGAIRLAERTAGGGPGTASTPSPGQAPAPAPAGGASLVSTPRAGLSADS